ncbi:hypothetical protein E2C01_066051 [Portunus trituberculatus]|uniref:Uncharacterized protein n=1 Tax=Portunus trituberculatus TaxID=210409 RepID=A0A5B7HQ22_PORTR|nr:hypothetical protein [Portunus trituberculatus]
MAVQVRLPPPPQPPWPERGTEGRPCRLPVSPPSACRLQSLPPPSAAISCTVALRLHLLLHKPPPPADWVGRVEMLVSGSEFPPSCRPPLTGWRTPEPSPPPRSPLRIGFPLVCSAPPRPCLSSVGFPLASNAHLSRAPPTNRHANR